jgi:hypothetical protein
MESGRLDDDPEPNARVSENGNPFLLTLSFDLDQITAKQDVRRMAEEPGHLENVFR